MTAPKVGGEIDAFCTRCKMLLAHTILAMVGSKVVRVQCNTCGGQHAFRSEAGATRAPAAPRERAAHREVISFEQRLLAKDVSQARRYSPQDTYAADELVSHPTFGIGIVNAVRSDKVDVAFKAFEKTLVHGRGATPAARPAFSPPAPKMDGPADKPQPPEAHAPQGATDLMHPPES